MSDFNFKFALGAKVTDPLGNLGIVKMLGVDDGGVQYHVQCSNNSNWWAEHQLAEYNPASSEISGIISSLDLPPKFELLRLDTVQTISFESIDAMNDAVDALSKQGVDFTLHAFPSDKGDWYRITSPDDLP